MRWSRGCTRGSSSRTVQSVRLTFTFLAEVLGTYVGIASQVLIDFMVRHGHLTPENEPRYVEITQRLHGQFDLERW